MGSDAMQIINIFGETGIKESKITSTHQLNLENVALLLFTFE